jgi:hypothetical protein
MTVEVKYEAAKLSEKILMKIAWKLPKQLVMWCSIRVIAHATTGEYGNEVVAELGAMEALDRWDR